MSSSTAAKTAISRWSISRPVALALEDGLISKETTFFDYGCGRGGDIRRLHDMGIEVSGWDPAYFPEEERTPADVVNLGYVINVIEDLEERAVVLYAAWNLAQRVLIVSARLEWEARQIAGDYQGDGIVTRKRTFQKFYTQEELRDWIKARTRPRCRRRRARHLLPVQGPGRGAGVRRFPRRAPPATSDHPLQRGGVQGK